MANKANNKTLIILLIALIGIFLFVRIFRSIRLESTMGRNLIEKIDTAKVNVLQLYPSSDKGSEIRFTKEGSKWMVEKGKIKTEAEENAIRSLLTEMANLKIDQLIAKGKDKWKENFVDDSSGSKIKIFEDKELLLEMVVGKFNYQPPKNQYQQQYGGGVSGNTCVRVGNNQDVYAVPGFLAYAINQPFNNWRNQNFIRTDKASVTKLTFKYPADSSFIIEKKDTVWFLGDKMPDKKNVESFLDKIAWKSNNAFVEDYVPVGNPVYQMTIEGKNMQSVVVSAYKQGENAFVLNSSLNPKNYFSSPRSGMVSEIFPKKEKFLKVEKKK
jgi:hypothetical protein